MYMLYYIYKDEIAKTFQISYDNHKTYTEGEVTSMGWKSVDLQVAIPRTLDASNLQNQMTKQHQRFQESLAQHQLREQLQKRKQVNEYEDTERLQPKKDESSSKQNQQERQHKKEQQQKEKLTNHPYLGNRFDLIR